MRTLLWPLYPLHRKLVPIIQEAVWVPGKVWIGGENIVPTMEFDPPDSAPHRVTLYPHHEGCRRSRDILESTLRWMSVVNLMPWLV